LGTELVALSAALSRCQYRLVVAAAAFAESPERILDGSPTPAHWLASVADVEASTAREWIRVGKALAVLPVTDDAFAARRLSYSKVRTLTRTATVETEAELVDLVAGVPASEVGKAIAGWEQRNVAPEEIEARQRAARSVKWRTDTDGMVVFTLRLQPHIAAVLVSFRPCASWRHDLGEYDHVPAYSESRRTVVEELQLRCAPCHHRRHHPPRPDPNGPGDPAVA
jgi:hypothetical protein